MNNPFDRNRVREPKLGLPITEDGPEIRRDAVHIAVIPMIAGESLRRGERVAITPEQPPRAFGNSKWVHDQVPGDSFASREDPSGSIGIVDPFLCKDVKEGERFWLFIYPGQVTTLSHVWTHPAFADEGVVPVPLKDKAASEVWLRAYAIKYLRYSTPEEGYAKLLEQMVEGTITYEGKDMHSRAELQDADALRYHAEIVLGRRINYDDFHYFSCTC